jgi:LuxR family transcriptional regulator, quorum-sensing system regulator BjaR1
MLLTETGFALVDQLERQKDVPSLIVSFQKVVQAFGMINFSIGDVSYHRAKREGGRWGGTTPESLHSLYARLNFYRKCPLIARANKQAAPFRFRWSAAQAGLDADGRQVMKHAMDLGLTDGLVVPIHQPDGSVHALSIPAANYDLSPQDERGLHLASLYLHARIAALRAQTSPRPARNLTPRERECLQWVAAGKTDWEISQILNISEQTAHGYVQSALTKLDARTRAQAVALALQSAQISP